MLAYIGDSTRRQIDQVRADVRWAEAVSGPHAESQSNLQEAGDMCEAVDLILGETPTRARDCRHRWGRMVALRLRHSQCLQLGEASHDGGADDEQIDDDDSDCAGKGREPYDGR